MFNRQKEDAPPGFALLERFPLVDDSPVRVEILLLQGLRDELVQEERRQRDEANKTQDIARVEAHRAMKKTSETNAKTMVDAMSDEDCRKPVAGQDYDPLEFMPVYDHDAPLKLAQVRTTRHSDRESRERIEAIVTKLKRKTNLRFVNYPLASAGRERLIALRQSHPHFGEVIDLVENQIDLALIARTRLSLPPILLWGPSGVGKTHFAQELGAMLGTKVHPLSYDSDLTGAALLGSDKKWSTSSHGAVFEALALGDHANPVLLLDEIDKAHRGFSGSDPLASLHSLLEPVSASKVIDISLEFEMDASAVIWIATANDPRKVAPTLRSRMWEFVIEMPDAEQCLQIAEAVGASVCQAMAVQDLDRPTRKVVALLAHLTPREQTQALRLAYAKAICGGRLDLSVEDVPQDYRDAAGSDARSRLFH